MNASMVCTRCRKCAYKKYVRVQIIQKVSRPTKTVPIFEPVVTKFESDCYGLNGVPHGFVCYHIAANYRKLRF